MDGGKNNKREGSLDFAVYLNEMQTRSGGLNKWEVIALTKFEGGERWRWTREQEGGKEQR